MKPTRKEWAAWYCLGAFVLGVMLAICTAEYGDGLRYTVKQFLLTWIGS